VTLDIQTVVMNLFAVSAMGAILFLVHGFILNPYLRHQNTLLTSIMLPPTALVITSVIASNFFLSLGMIGALSIIRYRTPVKSQYDLALLFALITIGVVGGVNMTYAFGIFAFLTLLAPVYAIAVKALPKSVVFKDSEKKSTSDLLISVSGDISDNARLFDIGGQVVSVDSRQLDGERETNIHLRFDTLESALDAQAKLKDRQNVLSVSLN
jgi:Ca2+/Na+ antiporter